MSRDQYTSKFRIRQRIRALTARPALTPDEIRELARLSLAACETIDNFYSSLSSFDGRLADHILERNHA